MVVQTIGNKLKMYGGYGGLIQILHSKNIAVRCILGAHCSGAEHATGEMAVLFRARQTGLRDITSHPEREGTGSVTHAVTMSRYGAGSASTPWQCRVMAQAVQARRDNVALWRRHTDEKKNCWCIWLNQWVFQRAHNQGVKNIGRWTQQHMVENRDVIEYQLAMLWRHGRAFTRKLTGYETTIVITRTILKLNSWDFLITSTIVWLKLLMSCNNSLRVTVLSLWR